MASACLAEDARFDTIAAATPCSEGPTHAPSVTAVVCTFASSRGVLVQSLDASGARVCAGNDAYVLEVEEAGGRLRFAALGRPLIPSHAYWFNVSVIGMMPGEYNLKLTLTSSSTKPTPSAILLPQTRVVVPEHETKRPQQPPPVCTTMLPSSDLAYVKLRDGECESWCRGNASARILDTSNAARHRSRRRLGFQHILAASSCRLRMHDERSLSACLDGRTLLLMGSTFNVDLQRGFALLNETIAQWTRTKPGKLHPNVADFWRAFEKPSGSYCYKPHRCAIAFGRGAVAFSSFHYPEGHGLANLKRSHFKRMCAAEIVVVESSYEDVVASIPGHGGKPRKEATTAAAAPARAGEQLSLVQYDERLKTLLRGWDECRKERAARSDHHLQKPWRAVFMLGAAPRGGAAPEAASSSTARIVFDAHLVAKLNARARRLVEAAGFEVFDPFAATLHAPAKWFEQSAYRAEPVSDLVTQMLVNQLCPSKEERYK